MTDFTDSNPGSRDRRIVDYLLERLSPDEQEEFEVGMMNDPALFDLVEATEGDLLIRYVRGQVDMSEGKRIEAVYGNGPRAVRLTEARKFSGVIDRIRPVAQASDPSGKVRVWRAPGFSRLSMAGAAIAATLLVTYGIREQFRTSVHPALAPVAVWTLEPGRERGEQQEGGMFSVPAPGVVRLEFPKVQCNEQVPCRVELLNAEADTAQWTGEAHRSPAGSWTADVPSSHLQRGDYIAEVAGPDGAKTSHQFRVQ